jgi:uncharacterized protein
MSQEKLMQLIISVIVAAILWFIMFGLKIFAFWPLMIFSASCLGAVSIFFNGKPCTLSEFNFINISTGVISAVFLYLIFDIGKFMLEEFFPKSPLLINQIYLIKGRTPQWLLIISLLLLIGPGEELFWRKYILGTMLGRFKIIPSLIISTSIYSLVHLPSGNPILIIAALVGGLYWGMLFVFCRSVVPGMISHALWDIAIFVLWPLY